MRMYDIIANKRNGKTLTNEEITFVVEGYTKGEIPDYQVSAWLMAIYFQGMTKEETAHLTACMALSGDTVDLSQIPGIKVDKHSTGGVGDKTTMVIAPIVAACGVPVAKMSGRGLGHTGGTVDKLEAIPGFCTTIEEEQFFDIVREKGLCVIGQTGNLAPADKKLYALRDVTATVDNISLIAASIMSKKIAAGADAILLDVKTGSGAFMKTIEDSIALAKEMVDIGEAVGRKTVALITDMDRPLGAAIGNTLEVIEAIDTLHNKGPKDLTEVCIELATNMLYLAEKGDIDTCRNQVLQVLENGRAFEKFKEMVQAQGGDVSVIEDTSRFEQAILSVEVKVSEAGYITSMDTEQCGIASVILGAGRASKEDCIDYSAGIVLTKKIGDEVGIGDTVAILYSQSQDKINQAQDMLLKAIKITKQQPKETPLIHARVTKNEIEKR